MWADMSSQAAWGEGLSMICALFGAFSEKELKQSCIISYRHTFEHVDLAALHLCQSTNRQKADRMTHMDDSLLIWAKKQEHRRAIQKQKSTEM